MAVTQQNSNQNVDVTRVQYTVKVDSDFMRQHLEQNIGSFITIYGRIGGLLRLVASNQLLSSMVHDWAHYNTQIAESSFSEVQAELESIELMEMDSPAFEITVSKPEPQSFTWNVNHASFTNLIKFIIKLDQFLVKAEMTYYKGLMTDSQHQSLTRQVNHILSTYLDRVLKATSPGKRIQNDKAKYNNKQLLSHIRDGGYRLEFESLSPEHQSIVEEYNQRYSKFKTLAAERELQRQSSLAKSEEVSSKSDDQIEKSENIEAQSSPSTPVVSDEVNTQSSKPPAKKATKNPVAKSKTKTDKQDVA